MEFALKKKRYRQNDKEYEDLRDTNYTNSNSTPDELLVRSKTKSEILLKNKKSFTFEKNLNNYKYTSQIITKDKKLIPNHKQLEDLKTRLSKQKNNEVDYNKIKYGFGNYVKYYYNRYLEAFKNTSTKILEEEWIKGKKCLDIGCNGGTLTLIIAIIYQPEIIQGIDIDPSLIKRAINYMKFVIERNFNSNYVIKDILSRNELRKNDISYSQKELKKSINSIKCSNNGEKTLNNIENPENEDLKQENGNNEINENLEKLKKMQDNLGSMKSLNNNQNLKVILNKINSMPKSFLNFLTINNDIYKKEKLNNINNPKNEKFPENISFKTENILLHLELSNDEGYDTIFCLSISKWVHLNYGDIGLELLFYIVYKMLKPGGLFIFEPQEWTSYKKELNNQIKIGNESKSKESFKLQPNYFVKFLSETFNFKLIKQNVLPSNSKKMVERNLYIFQKQID